MEAVIQISEVNSKDVNTSRGVSTVYNIKAQDGKEFSTFKKDLGQQAGQLRGQWATVEYTEVQKGKYTNYYLDSVKPAEGLTTLPVKPAKPEYRTPEQIVRDGALKAAVDTVVGLQMEDASALSIIQIARVYESWISDGEKADAKNLVPFETTSSGVDADLVKF